MRVKIRACVCVSVCFSFILLVPEALSINKLSKNIRKAKDGIFKINRGRFNGSHPAWVTWRHGVGEESGPRIA